MNTRRAMDRRRFLTRLAQGAGAIGLTAALPAGIARAAEAEDRYFVFCYFEGGWDLLLGLDPRDPAVFTPGRVMETGIEPGYHLLQAGSQQIVDAGPYVLGPAAGALASVAEHVSLVRGINMATLTHEVGRRYFITGRPPAGLKARGSSVATVAAEQLGGELPVPHLAHRVESYAVDAPAYAAAMPVAAVSHMRFVLREHLGIPTSIRQSVKDALAEYHARHGDCPDSGAGRTRLADLYRSNRARSSALVQGNAWQAFEFDGPQTAGLRQHYGFTNPETAAGRAALAAQALKTGLSRVVSVVLSDQLDTHGNDWPLNHPTRLGEGFTALARLIEDLRDSEAPGGGSLLDKTTLVGFSEFGRTPRLNPRGGRDHNLTNAAFLAGAGIAGGRVVGASSDIGLGPSPIDVATGLPSEAGVSLNPEHVMTTALVAAGLNASALRSEPLPTLLSQG